MKKILVLQGSGFVAPHVVTQAKDMGFSVAVLAVDPNTEVLTTTAITSALSTEKPDAIINCAGNIGGMHYVNSHAADVIRDNTQLIINLYEAVATTSPKTKIISCLGNCSYPGEAHLQKEPEWQYGPVHDTVLPFAITKRLQYAMAESYRRQYGIRTVHWIAANNYGPGGTTDPARERALNGIIIRLIQAQKKGEKTFEIWGTGTPVREWLYVSDAAQIMLHSVEHVSEQTYPINIAKKEGYSIKEVVLLAAQQLDYDVQFTFNTNKPDGAVSKIMDDTAFRLKYPDFIFTPLVDGIRETIHYYQSQLT